MDPPYKPAIKCCPCSISEVQCTTAGLEYEDDGSGWDKDFVPSLKPGTVSQTGLLRLGMFGVSSHGDLGREHATALNRLSRLLRPQTQQRHRSEKASRGQCVEMKIAVVHVPACVMCPKYWLFSPEGRLVVWCVKVRFCVLFHVFCFALFDRRKAFDMSKNSEARFGGPPVFWATFCVWRKALLRGARKLRRSRRTGRFCCLSFGHLCQFIFGKHKSLARISRARAYLPTP